MASNVGHRTTLFHAEPGIAHLPQVGTVPAARTGVFAKSRLRAEDLGRRRVFVPSQHHLFPIPYSPFPIPYSLFLA
ncbi:MAG: hypothetical protein ACLQOO_04455 [Terriglobia bacterium]